MPEPRKVTRSQVRAAQALNNMGRGTPATRAIANAQRAAQIPATATRMAATTTGTAAKISAFTTKGAAVNSAVVAEQAINSARWFVVRAAPIVKRSAQTANRPSRGNKSRGTGGHQARSGADGSQEG